MDLWFTTCHTPLSARLSRSDEACLPDRPCRAGGWGIDRNPSAAERAASGGVQAGNFRGKAVFRNLRGARRFALADVLPGRADNSSDGVDDAAKRRGTTGCPSLSRFQSQQIRATRSFSSLPGTNLTSPRGGMTRFSPRLRGLRPTLGFETRRSKVPKFRRVTVLF